MHTYTYATAYRFYGLCLFTQAQQAKISAEIQQNVEVARQKWKQEHENIVQETVKEALAKTKHEYEGTLVQSINIEKKIYNFFKLMLCRTFKLHIEK